jgi:hypothetical protein
MRVSIHCGFVKGKNGFLKKRNHPFFVMGGDFIEVEYLQE